MDIFVFSEEIDAVCDISVYLGNQKLFWSDVEVKLKWMVVKHGKFLYHFVFTENLFSGVYFTAPTFEKQDGSVESGNRKSRP